MTSRTSQTHQCIWLFKQSRPIPRPPGSTYKKVKLSQPGLEYLLIKLPNVVYAWLQRLLQRRGDPLGVHNYLISTDERSNDKIVSQCVKIWACKLGLCLHNLQFGCSEKRIFQFVYLRLIPSLYLT